MSPLLSPEPTQELAVAPYGQSDDEKDWNRWREGEEAILSSPAVMVNLMCPLDWAKEFSDSW